MAEELWISEDILLTMESSGHSIWRGPRGGEAFLNELSKV